MRALKKMLVSLGGAAALFVACIGPWPTDTSGFEHAAYFARDLAAIERQASLSQLTLAPGHLLAGWSVRALPAGPGLPMAGYGARQNIREYLFGAAATGLATGVHDPLHVKALALSDGRDTAVLVGSDLLLVPPTVAEAVRREVARQTPLTANGILFGASHTHNGPGGWGAGLAAFVTAGAYRPQVTAQLTDAFTQAIVSAYRDLSPARLAHGNIDASAFVRNRRHDAPVDPRLGYLIAEQENGRRCVLLRFSAHPTNVGTRFLEMTAEYPGYLQAAVEAAAANTTALYIGGSLGSSGPCAPEGGSDIGRAQAMGEALADQFLKAFESAAPAWQTNTDVAAVGIPLELPTFQMRLTPHLRVSPLVPKLLGVPHQGWLQAVRVGDLVLVGLPGDFSGEISANWAAWGKANGVDLWPTSFCGAYDGYLSPDHYYFAADATRKDETGFMSWLGPHQEAFFTALMQHAVVLQIMQ